MSDRPPNSDHPYHCHLHGWWSAIKESGCPTCVVEARKRIAKLERELAAALALSEQRRAMLEKHQWDAHQVVDDGLGDYYCDECGNIARDGHAPDCELARLIKEK